MKTLRLLSVVLLGAGLMLNSACSWLTTEQEDETANWSASRLYSEAKAELNRGNYASATELLEKLQARYPFGRYAQQAQLEQIYAHYKSGEADLAIAAADRFIRTHPRHPFVDYAYYLKGLTNYDRGVSILEKLFPSDPTRTDTATAQQSFNDFAELVQKFPDSKYSEDAQQRMLFLRNNLARYEINVADYYMRRKAYVAAANRAKYVLENYSTTPASAAALAIMVQAYRQLGLTGLADDSLRVLRLNYPQSPELAELEGRPIPADSAEPGFSLFGFKLF